MLLLGCVRLRNITSVDRLVVDVYMRGRAKDDEQRRREDVGLSLRPLRRLARAERAAYTSAQAVAALEDAQCLRSRFHFFGSPAADRLQPLGSPATLDFAYVTSTRRRRRRMQAQGQLCQ